MGKQRLLESLQEDGNKTNDTSDISGLEEKTEKDGLQALNDMLHPSRRPKVYVTHDKDAPPIPTESGLGMMLTSVPKASGIPLEVPSAMDTIVEEKTDVDTIIPPPIMEEPLPELNLE